MILNEMYDDLDSLSKQIYPYVKNLNNRTSFKANDIIKKYCQRMYNEFKYSDIKKANLYLNLINVINNNILIIKKTSDKTVSGLTEFGEKEIIKYNPYKKYNIKNIIIKINISYKYDSNIDTISHELTHAFDNLLKHYSKIEDYNKNNQRNYINTNLELNQSVENFLRKAQKENKTINSITELLKEIFKLVDEYKIFIKKDKNGEDKLYKSQSIINRIIEKFKQENYPENKKYKTKLGFDINKYYKPGFTSKTQKNQTAEQKKSEQSEISKMSNKDRYFNY